MREYKRSRNWTLGQTFQLGRSDRLGPTLRGISLRKGKGKAAGKRQKTRVQDGG